MLTRNLWLRAALFDGFLLENTSFILIKIYTKQVQRKHRGENLLKALSSLLKKLSLPKDYKKEFGEQNRRFNNTAFLVAAAFIFVLVIVSLFTCYTALKDVSPESFKTVWPPHTAMLLLTAWALFLCLFSARSILKG